MNQVSKPSVYKRVKRKGQYASGGMVIGLGAGTLFARKHFYRGALDFVNRERIKAGYEPLDDLPRGLRGSDAHNNPIARGIGREYEPGVPPGGSAPAQVLDAWFDVPQDLWLELFDAGFFPEYNEALPQNVKDYLSKRERLLTTTQGFARSGRERYYRFKQVTNYALKKR